ncbi:hypothetical protein NY78_0750 [Desulfovibrio sp. TomC]|nr:hypothetical protein NY78_0750 [Desulfovibrio sp. TomC]
MLLNTWQAEVTPMFVEKLLLVSMVVVVCFALSRLADAVLKPQSVD